MKSLIRGNEKSKCGVPEVLFGCGGGTPGCTGSVPVLGWYRFDWSVTVPGTGLLLFSNSLLRNVKIVFYPKRVE